MRYGKLILAIVGLAAANVAAMAQTPAPSSQQPIPDAPRPQTLPQLNTITPPAAALPQAPAAPASPNAAASDTVLPSTPVATTSASPDDLPPELPPPGQGVFRIPVNVNFVEVPFTVKDTKGQLVPGLTWRDVQVYENGLKQHMSFFTVDPFPLSVALVIDQSVDFETMTKVNNALGALQGAFAPYDEVAVFTYNNGVKMQDDGFDAAQSARLGAILIRAKAPGREPNMAFGSALDQTTVKNNLPVDPNTNRGATVGSLNVNPEREFHTLNDAILAAAEQTSKAARGRRRIVYVISDGKEYGSVAKEKEVVQYCQRNKVAVYATLVGNSTVPGLGFLDRIHLPLTMRDNALPRYAGATGGQIDPEFRQGGIEKSFARITEEVRSQYTVGYYSREPLIDGKFRKVEVRVLKPNLTVIAKEGYYPSASDSRPAPVTPTAVP